MVIPSNTSLKIPIFNNAITIYSFFIIKSVYVIFKAINPTLTF